MTVPPRYPHSRRTHTNRAGNNVNCSTKAIGIVRRYCKTTHTHTKPHNAGFSKSHPARVAFCFGDIC